MTVRLAEVGTWRSGGTPPKDQEELWDGGFPWISTRDLKQPELHGSTVTITEDAANRFSTTVPAGSVLIGTRGMALAKRLPVAMVTRAVAFNQDIKAIEPHPAVSSKYLLYALLAFEGPILALTDEAAHGTKRLDTDLLRGFQIPCPSLVNQQRIADFLDAETARIDEVIGYRARLSNLVSERSRAAIDDALSMAARLRLKVGLKARPDYGAAESSIEGDLAWPRFIRITDIDDRGQLRGDDVRRLPADVALPFMLDTGDILVARSGATVGKAFHFRSELHGDACFAGYLIRLRCDPARLLPEYLALITQSGGWWRQVDEAIQQATIQNVSAATYADFVVPMPSVAAQASVLARLTPLLVDHANVGAAIDRQINLLRERRQALITAAVTGKLEIPDTSMANAAA